MAYCTHCGRELPEGSKFCTSCGAPIEQPGTQTALDEQPVKDNKARHLTVVLSALAVILVAAIGFVLFVIVRAPSSAPANQETTASQTEDKQGDGTKSDAQDEATEEIDVYAKAADAYNTAIEEGDSSFGEWYEQKPDGELRYFLADLTNDDIPELVLLKHYSNVGSHTSGGQRMIPLVYNAKNDSLSTATSSEFEMLLEPWVGYGRSADGHALICEMRYAKGTESEWYRVYVNDGGTLVRDKIEAQDLNTLQQLNDVEASDRSLVNAMRDGADTNSQEATEESTEETKDSAQDIEAEHARLREEAAAQGMQVFTGTVRYTTVGERANEVNPQLRQEFSSSAGDRMVLVNFDGAQSLNAKSGDGMGMRDGSTEAYEVTNPDEIGLVDGTRVCIGVRAEDAYYSSSIRYELVPVSGPATLIYTE